MGRQRRDLEAVARRSGLLLKDLVALLDQGPEGILGGLIRLNALPHYRNRLNVVELACALQTVRDLSGPSAAIPVSSGPTS